MQLKHLSLAALVGAAAAQQQNLTGILASNNQTSQLASFLGAFPELTSALANAQNITLLAPSNQALGTLLNSTAGQQLMNNTGLAQAILQYHVLNGTYPASAITNTSSFIPTLLTNQTYANVTGGQVVQGIAVRGNVTFFSGLFQNATVVQPNLNFSGGVIHVINHVLTLPQNVTSTARATNLTALTGALGAANLNVTVDRMRDVTIFAPNNEAFRSIGSALQNLTTQQLAGILSYHVVEGRVRYSSSLMNNTQLQTVAGPNITITMHNGTVFANGARVVTPDVLVSNGVVHVIDNVLNPNATSASPSASATSGAPAFTGASTASDVPFTSGQPTPTTSVSAPTGGAGAAASSSTKSGAAVPMKTGAVGAAALFGAGVAMLNY